MKTYTLPVDMNRPNIVLVTLTSHIGQEGLHGNIYKLFIQEFDPQNKVGVNVENSKALARLFAVAGIFKTHNQYMLPFILEGNYNGYSDVEIAKLIIETEFMGDMLAKADNIPHFGIPENVLIEEKFGELLDSLHPKNILKKNSQN